LAPLNHPFFSLGTQRYLYLGIIKLQLANRAAQSISPKRTEAVKRCEYRRRHHQASTRQQGGPIIFTKAHQSCKAL